MVIYTMLCNIVENHGKMFFNEISNNLHFKKSPCIPMISHYRILSSFTPFETFSPFLYFFMQLFLSLLSPENEEYQPLDTKGTFLKSGVRNFKHVRKISIRESIVE